MLNSLTISELTAKLTERECTAREAMEACLDQVRRVDGKIKAFLSYDADDVTVTVSIGAEVPTSNALPHLVVIAPGERKTFRVGGALRGVG